jgi:hypothetical protein
VNSLKTICVAIVLSAVGYGAYVTLTGKPTNEPPPEAENWEVGPQIELPGSESIGGSAPGSAPAGLAMPGAEATPAQTTPPPIATPATPLTESPAALPTESAPPAAPAGTALPGTSIAGSVPPSTPLNDPTVAQATAVSPALSAASTTPTMPASPTTPGQFTLAPDGIAAPSASDPHAEFVAALTAAQALLDQGRLSEAHLELSNWCDNPRLPVTDHSQLMDLLDQLAGTVVYSRQNLLEPAYVVQPGDTLQRVGELYNVPWQLLAKINGIPDPQYLRTGDQLKVLRGPFDASISLHDFEMTLLLRGRYAGRFRIGIGQDQSTPEGEFVVREKVMNPAYQTIPAGDPNNPLGGRWIDLGNQIGIHGTNDPQSIGRADSRGCVRLSPTDIDDVFDILSVGSKVVIRR